MLTSRTQVIRTLVAHMFEAVNLEPSDFSEIYDRRDQIALLAVAYDIPGTVVDDLWRLAMALTIHPAGLTNEQLAQHPRSVPAMPA